ncbi:MAG: hypothetical protein LLG05_13355 [Porphyromonadaceae bacterium]|nr:hypothetical protein [Porphyromonadaceae bacterium]
MLKIKRIFLVSICILSQLSLFAQNNTNSPYTRFGYGELADRSFGAGRSMGGIGYGLRSSKQINPLNPASYTSIDSMTFIFDFGASAQLSWFNDGTNKQSNYNGNIEYLAMQFPLHKRVAMSLGVLPYSYVGYDFGAVKQAENSDMDYIENFVGTGGLNEVYAGLSIDIWKKRLSVGANVGYFFGNITHQRNLSFGSGSEAYAVYREQKLDVRDIKLDFGLQYTHPLGLKESLNFGLVFAPSNHLNTTSYDINSYSNVVESDTITGQNFDIPSSYGAGITYVKKDKLTLGGDFLYQSWDKAKFFDKSNEFKNRIRVALGGEFIPGYAEKNFLSRMSYRGGVHYSNSYLNINGNGYKEYGASVGFGLPLVDGRSIVNLSVEYVKIKPELKTMIDEQYLRFTVNYTFNERWFFKWKLD